MRFRVFVSRERVKRVSLRFCCSARGSKLRLERYLTRGQILHVLREFLFVLCSRDERPFDLKFIEVGLLQFLLGQLDRFRPLFDGIFHIYDFFAQFFFVFRSRDECSLNLKLL